MCDKVHCFVAAIENVIDADLLEGQFFPNLQVHIVGFVEESADPFPDCQNPQLMELVNAQRAAHLIPHLC